jgi:ABC-type polysaccharide/polyol phosphate export permease
MKLNPLTYGVTAIRHGLYWQQPDPHAWLALALTFVFAIVMSICSLWAAQRTTSGDLL